MVYATYKIFQMSKSATIKEPKYGGVFLEGYGNITHSYLKPIISLPDRFRKEFNRILKYWSIRRHFHLSTYKSNLIYNIFTPVNLNASL